MTHDGKPRNPLAGTEWHRHGWTIDVENMEPFPIVAGMARCLFGVTPDWNNAEDRTMPVSITHLPTGMILAECPNGAAAMEAVDDLIFHHGYMFGRWPLRFDDLAPALDSIVEILKRAGCRPMVEE